MSDFGKGFEQEMFKEQQEKENPAVRMGYVLEKTEKGKPI